VRLVAWAVSCETKFLTVPNSLGKGIVFGRNVAHPDRDLADGVVAHHEKLLVEHRLGASRLVELDIVLDKERNQQESEGQDEADGYVRMAGK
jgi:hypothetical protein